MVQWLVQQLKALAALREDLGFNAQLSDGSSHLFVTSILGPLLAFVNTSHAHSAQAYCSTQTYMQGKKLATYIK